MSHDLYHNRVFELSLNVPAFAGKPMEASVTKHSRLCGSVVTVGVCLDEAGELITDFDMEAKACALGQAAAGILANDIIGATLTELRETYKQLEAMLKEGGDPPAGRFWELRHLAGVADYPPRHASTLLAFRAVIAAIDAALESRDA